MTIAANLQCFAVFDFGRSCTLHTHPLFLCIGPKRSTPSFMVRTRTLSVTSVTSGQWYLNHKGSLFHSAVSFTWFTESLFQFFSKKRVFFELTMKLAAFGGKLAASENHQKLRNFIIVSAKKTASKNIHIWLFGNFWQFSQWNLQSEIFKAQKEVFPIFLGSKIYWFGIKLIDRPFLPKKMFSEHQKF